MMGTDKNESSFPKYWRPAGSADNPHGFRRSGSPTEKEAALAALLQAFSSLAIQKCRHAARVFIRATQQ